MASSSSSHRQIQEFNVSSGIEPAGKRRKVSESTKLFDVFINHRGPDVKETLATQLYNCLQQLGIRAFLDKEEKELGNSFPSTIETAIRSAKVHIAIFSKRYAESPWCLAELVLMLDSQAKIIPVFYEVKPSDLRHIEKGAYADAFKKYEEKGRYLEKHNQWKEALQSLSLIAGEEFDRFSDCKNIIVAVQEEVKRKTCFHVAEYPVGLNNLVEDFERHCLEELVQDFENQFRLKTVKNKVVVVGIFGMGGSGKTTLAKELFNRKMSTYSRASFLFDVREASARSNLPYLQLKLLKDLFDTHHLNFTSTEEGISYLKDNLQRSPGHLSFLIVVDDIDHVQQLNALLVRDILKKSGINKALVIVTTRDVGVLVTSGLTVGYNLKGMDKNHGRKLFCWHAFGQSHPCTGHESVVNEFVDVCGGLPLSLQVLGRHVHGRAHSYWRSQLIKARMMLPRDVKQRLKISFEALDDEQKQVFMDIACFFVGRSKGTAERVWEASGWNAQHALETLKDKCLVEEINEIRGDVILLRMHDHLRDLGREMALELSPPQRLWRPQDLKSSALMGFKNVLTQTNMRCFHSIFDKSIGSQVTFFLGQSHNCVETSASLLWLKLEGNSTEQSSIPSWIPLQNLHHLEIHSGQLNTLRENNIEAPSRLKELLIYENSLKEFPDLSGISDSLENGFLESLEKLVISGEYFVSKILISGIHYPSLDSITLEYMGNLMEVNLRSVKTLKSLAIVYCDKLTRLTGTSHLTNLVLLRITQCPDLEELRLAHPSCLERITIGYCTKLRSVLGISDLLKLVELDIYYCEKLKFDHLSLSGMKCLERMTFDKYVKVKYFELDSCQNLKTIQFGCEELVGLSIRTCPELERLPIFRGPSCLEKIIIDRCRKLKCLQLDGCQILKTIQFGCEELVELNIRGSPELEELTIFRGPNCLERVIIDGCGKLKCLQVDGCQNLESVLGIFNLAKLVELEICGCGKQDFDHLCLSGLKCLERIKFDTLVKFKYFELDGCQILKSIQFGCEELVEFSIRGCPKVEELPVFRGPSFLERIIIDGCEKLKCLQVDDCRNLKTIQFGCEELVVLSLRGCPELENFLLFRVPSCLERIIISGCGKLKCLQVDGCPILKSVCGI
ncbi:hypothetical protein SUGI_0673660 [Cryptomeria japonica]|uniref:disease resistance protein Roq1 n=1 Tax=Cryptomeria japonica TaxID=3369 RepID=UPI0024146BF3|nr:disease resistance protein Roq1 [Cryptomeria japonica]XP_059063939.1 disease resistance protein Roq1 [Cryptomeria japonica]GLJ33487.1 hypothetical protein SUGI_0673660 [Cryptomeria japonica]